MQERMSDRVIKHKSLFESVIPFLDCWRTEGGGVATFMASPYAPLKEWLSRTMKEPGSRSFNTEIAAQREKRRRQLAPAVMLLLWFLI